jgi:hypothetical protein
VILADTSVWVSHLRSSSRELARALADGEVLDRKLGDGGSGRAQMRIGMTTAT